MHFAYPSYGLIPDCYGGCASLIHPTIYTLNYAMRKLFTKSKKPPPKRCRANSSVVSHIPIDDGRLGSGKQNPYYYHGAVIALVVIRTYALTLLEN